jgi:hypothetical protein
MINIERKAFSDMSARREGVYGLKLHIPFGTAFNIYGFMDISDADSIFDFAFSGKLEALIDNTEVSLSAWGKDEKVPIFGLDITTRLFNINFWGEVTLSYGDNIKKISIEDTLPKEETIGEELVPKICIGFSKSFDLLEESDRLSITGEYFYNHIGYKEDMFEPETQFFFLPNLAKMDYGPYYIPNNYGVHYAALFVMINKFILSDMSFSLNAIGNLSDLSFTVISGLSYSPVYNFFLNLSIASYWGEEYREFTFSGNACTLSLDLFLKF